MESAKKKVRVFVIGPRGFPGVQGGIEKFSEELYPLLTGYGCDVTSFAIRGFSKQAEWKGVKLIHLPVPQIKGLERLFYNFLSTVICLVKRPDIIHIHSISSGTFIFLLKLFGLKVVTRYNSMDYLHSKWGWAGKLILKFSESQFFLSDCITTNNKSFLAYLQNKDPEKKILFIPNGIDPDPPVPADKAPENFLQFGLLKYNFILTVGRIAPEKNFETLIEAYITLNTSVKLVICGEAADNNKYAEVLMRKYKSLENIIFTGKQNRESLNWLYVNTLLFILPSLSEGMPNVVLEAMSYKCPVILSSIPAHTDFNLNPEDYYSTLDVAELTGKIQRKLQTGKRLDYSALLGNYSWDQVAGQTWSVFQSVMPSSKLH